MAPLSEAVVINMPVCEAVQLAPPPAPAQDKEVVSGGEENDALVGCSIRCGKFAMIRLLFLGLVAVIVVVAMVLVLKPDDPVTTSTSSTATSTGTMSTAIVTSTSSTSSTTTPEMNTVVSETSIMRALCFFVDRVQCLKPSSFDLNIRLPVRAPDEHSHRDQHEQHLQHDNARNDYRE